MNIELIEKPFPKELIKKLRKGQKGPMLSYVEHINYIERLNQVFDHKWSFEIVEGRVEGGFVVVKGKLTADGVTKEQYGGSMVTISKDSGEMVQLGDDFKSAASDALKKCASLFGIGAHLYQEEKPTAGAKTGKEGKTQPPASSPDKSKNADTKTLAKLHASLQASIKGLFKSPNEQNAWYAMLKLPTKPWKLEDYRKAFNAIELEYLKLLAGKLQTPLGEFSKWAKEQYFEFPKDAKASVKAKEYQKVLLNEENLSDIASSWAMAHESNDDSEEPEIEM